MLRSFETVAKLTAKQQKKLFEGDNILTNEDMKKPDRGLERLQDFKKKKAAKEADSKREKSD